MNRDIPHHPLPKTAPTRILILRLSSIGDIVLASPFIRVLRQRFPQAQIDFVVKAQFADLVRSNPHLNTVFTLDTTKGRRGLAQLKSTIRTRSYDLIIDIHNNFRTAYLRRISGASIVTFKKYKLQRFFLIKFGLDFYRSIVPVYQRYIDSVAALQVRDDGLGPEFFVIPDASVRVASVLSSMGLQSDKSTIAMAPGAGFLTKRWPSDYFIEIAGKLIADRGAQIVLLGDKKEADLCTAIAKSVGKAVINAAGRFTLMESAAALAACDLIICNDTGLMHLATALKKPVVAIFGPTTRQLGFFPFGQNSRVVENINLACRPCTHIGRNHCPKKHFKCMKEILPAQVYDAAEELLRNKSLT
jgi:lipopolysaccharide heptosyltransferase II